MAAVKLNRLCNIFVYRSHVRSIFGKKYNACLKIGRKISASAARGDLLQTKTKYGCTAVEVKSAVAGRRRQASSCAVQYVASRNGDHDNSGSSGKENSGTKKIAIRLPWTENIQKLAFLLTNVISPAECQRFIDITEQIGYRSDLGQENSTGSVCLWEAREEAADLLEALRPNLPGHWCERIHLSGLSDTLRFERYSAGTLSKPRRDGAYLRAQGDISYLTILLFLNDVEEGGITSLVSPPVCDKTTGSFEAHPTERVDIQPKAGSVLVFQNDVFYETVNRSLGTKYVLKGEVLYNKIPKRSMNNFMSANNFFSGRSTNVSFDKTSTVDPFQPTTWFFSSNVPKEKADSTSKPRGVPFYVPQRKEFIYVG